MVIPLSVGFLLSRKSFNSFASRVAGTGFRPPWKDRADRVWGDRYILGLLFSASRMGVTSLLFSFSSWSFSYGGAREKEDVRGSLS